MDGWVDYLHVSFFGEHVLFHWLRLDSFWTFCLSSVLVAMICLVERFLTAFSGKKTRPRWASHSRFACASWDASLYGLVTLFRVLYMLIIMSYQAGIIAVVVISLSVGQFFVEYHLNYVRAADSDRLVSEPLLGYPAERLGVRAKSKPAAIFIHPYESNLARADAAALELGIAGDTELVAGNRLPDDGAWECGKGSIVARELFGGSSQS
ncbi:hypothetical protein BKA83DRAFT_4201556 [Pisolithus microcarpus]|nr:hypothetical protein BKA83DRAFT_4201556 [Pisolithus microcarpus]